MTALNAAIRPIRTEVPQRKPQPADLLVGELAANLADKRLYSKTSAGEIVLMGDGGGTSAGDGPPTEPGEQPNQLYVQLPVDAASGDPLFSSVGLLVQPQGPDGSISFADQSSNAHTITRVGDVVQSTGQLKYAPASLLFDGSGDALLIGDGAWANLSGGPFTVEAWFYATDLTSPRTIVQKGTFGSNYSWGLLVDSSGVYTYTNNIAGDYNFTSAVTVTPNTWHHVALVGDGSTMAHYLDGVRVGTKARTLTNASATVTVGASNHNNLGDLFVGYIAGVRISNAERYDITLATCTVPTEQWPATDYVAAVGALQAWLWDDTAGQWFDYPVQATVRYATDVADVDPLDNQLLAYDLASGHWVPTGAMQAARARTFTAVSGTISIDSSRYFTGLVFSGVNPEAVFLPGTPGAAVEIVNRSTNSLQLIQGTGASLVLPSGLQFIRPGGSAEAFYASGAWTVQGDLYDPGVAAVFNLEDAQDYQPQAGKADGDLLTWEASTSSFTLKPLDAAAVEAIVQAGVQLGELANVNIAAAIDQQFLYYDATAGEWRAQLLPLDQIAEDVQLRTNLGELSDVTITAPANLDQLAYDSTSGTWINVPGGDITLKADKLATMKQVAADYTVVESDSSKVLEVVAAAVISLPSGVPGGFQVVVVQTGTGDVRFTAPTLYASGGRDTLRDQYSVATAIHLGSGIWYVFGDLRLQGVPPGGLVESLDDLDDVVLTAPVSGHVLTYNGSAWVNLAPGQAVSSTLAHLLHADTPGAVPVADDGPDGLSLFWTSQDQAANEISATQSVFGGASLRLSGVNSGYSVNPGPMSDTWSADLWVWIDPTQPDGLYGRVIATPGWFVGVNLNTNGIYLDTYVDGNFSNEVWSGGGYIATGTWYHVAVQRSGTIWRLWVNGSHLGSFNEASQSGGEVTVDIGRQPGGYNFLAGYVDEVYITPGVLRFPDDGTGFTPPTAAYT